MRHTRRPGAWSSRAPLPFLAIALALSPIGQLGLRAEGESTSSAPAAKELLANVCFIGASATAGFGVVATVENSSPSLVPVPLAAAFSGAVGESVGAHDFGSPFFFMAPGKSGRTQVDQALEHRPTLVVASDFLFWYVYGVESATGAMFKEEADRIVNLEAGLAQLDRFDRSTPLVIGDFPDMRRAVGKMISPRQMPAEDTLRKASARVHAWAEARGKVGVLPLANLVAQLNGKQTITAGGITFDPAQGKLIQSDELHPTFRGAISMGLRIAEIVNERFLADRHVPLAGSEAQAAAAAKEAAKRLLAARAGAAATSTSPASDAKAKDPSKERPTPAAPESPAEKG